MKLVLSPGDVEAILIDWANKRFTSAVAESDELFNAVELDSSYGRLISIDISHKSPEAKAEEA